MPVAGQTPQAERPGSIRVVVHDATDLPIAGAEVVLTAADGSTTRVTTNERGDARVEGLRPGVYSGRVESVGFNPFSIEPFSIRVGGRVTREVRLQVTGFAEQLDVIPTADDQRLRSAFTDQLTADQLAALPEDPEELALVLRQLVGISGWMGSAVVACRPVPRSRMSASGTTSAPPRAAVVRASRSGPCQAVTGGGTTPV
jgi:hypothetical protein